MGSVSIEPLSENDVEEFWQVHSEGLVEPVKGGIRTLVDEYWSAPQAVRATYHSIKIGGRMEGTIRISGGFAEPPLANLSGFYLRRGSWSSAPQIILKALQMISPTPPGPPTAMFPERYLQVFERVGFERWFSRMQMRGSTSSKLPSGRYKFAPSLTISVDRLSRFFIEAYEGHIDQDFGMHVGSLQDWSSYVESLQMEKSDPLLEAASLALDAAGILEAAIVINLSRGLPMVSEFAVSPQSRGRGIGRDLLRESRLALRPIADSVDLFVTLGNDRAVDLYLSEGFARLGDVLVWAKSNPS